MITFTSDTFHVPEGKIMSWTLSLCSHINHSFQSQGFTEALLSHTHAATYPIRLIAEISLLTTYRLTCKTGHEKGQADQYKRFQALLHCYTFPNVTKTNCFIDLFLTFFQSYMLACNVTILYSKGIMSLKHERTILLDSAHMGSPMCRMVWQPKCIKMILQKNVKNNVFYYVLLCWLNI